MKEFLFVLRNYANFKGRAGRREYWLYTLCVAILMFIVSFLAEMSGQRETGGVLAFLPQLLQLGLLFPTIAVTARRLHDVNYSGWWQGLPILLGMLGGAGFAMQIAWLGLPAVIGSLGSLVWLLYLYCRKGDEGENRFGPQAPVIT